MKTIIHLVILIFAFASCSNTDNIDEPQPAVKNVYQFTYSKSNYSVKDITLYKGSAGEKSHPNETYLKNYWDIQLIPWEKISVDVKKNLIYLNTGTSAEKSYSIERKKDSLFIPDNNELTYIGLFNQNNNSLQIRRSFRVSTKMPRENSGLIHSKRNIIGLTRYQDMFYKYGTFESPAGMTEPDDEVLWSNIDYNYQSL